MKMEKIGCFLLYSIFMIIIGMGLYKYRVEVLAYISQEYNGLMDKITHKAETVKDDIKVK